MLIKLEMIDKKRTIKDDREWTVNDFFGLRVQLQP